MKTTLYVDRKLLREAMELAGLKGITETIEAALKDFVRRKRLEKLAASLGKVDLALDDVALEEIRRDD
ncbi:MAG: type II toxin-antitoxin system VapB family antitoxin [Firmicutes bacterium]|nr:type II toxin-antitoxin system VapB family antitoxin [Bacillota bacterium]